jgi:chromosomal replication initiation ATPase DnaA
MPSIAFIDSAVDEIFSHVTKCQRTRIFIYALRYFTDGTGKEIAELTGRSPSTVTHIWNRINERLMTDRELKAKMDELIRYLEKECVS